MVNLERLRRKLRISGEVFQPTQAQSCGVVAFDLAMNGGLPEGKIIELFGNYSAGKSLLGYHSLVEVQKNGGLCLLTDTEDALNVGWVTSLGLDMDKVIYISPATAIDKEEITIEYVFRQLGEFVEIIKADSALKALPAIYIWDSVAATKSEEEGDSMEYKPEMALRARVIGQMVRKVPSLIAGTRVIVMFVNQLRDKPGVIFGDKEETPGGRAIKYHAHLRLSLKKKAKIIIDKRPVGVSGVFEVAKSKVGKPFKTVEFQLMFEGGISKYSGLKDYLVREGVVTAIRGGWGQIGNYKFREINDESWAIIQRAMAGEEVSGEQANIPTEAQGEIVEEVEDE